MTHIVSVMQLEGVEIKGLEKFIAHWRKIKDMPCEDMGIETLGERNLQLKLYYPLDIFDKSVTQFITILFGELTLIASFGRARFVDLQLPNAVYKWFGGPKFGAEKLKTRFGVEEWPMLGAIIKPAIGKGLSIKIVEGKIERVLNAGFHIIKDDEMQGNLPYVPLKERVKFAKKYKKYVPALNLDGFEDYKKIIAGSEAEEIGMVLVNASTIGFPLVHELRKVSKVPILSHVALQGAYMHALSHKVFATLHRLFGCDAFTVPIGDTGYFNVNRAEEKEMVLEFSKGLPIKQTLPLLTGGARMNNLIDLMQPYEALKISYGILFGTLIFASGESPEKMCAQVVEGVKEFKRGK